MDLFTSTKEDFKVVKAGKERLTITCSAREKKLHHQQTRIFTLGTTSSSSLKILESKSKAEVQFE